MNKISMFFMAGAVIFFSNCVGNNPTKYESGKGQQSLWDDMFGQVDRDFNDLFSSSMSATEPSIMVDDESFFSNTVDVTRALQRAKDLAYKINQLASQGLHSLNTRSLAGLEQALNDVREKIKDGPASLAAIEKDLKAYGERLSQLKRYSMKAVLSENGQSYIVTINLPGFEEKDIKVTISKTEHGAARIQRTLQVVAPRESEKKDEGNVENDADKNGAKKRVVKQSTFRSQTTVLNGVAQRVEVRDGVVTFSCDLPAAVNEKTYNMTFSKDGVLTITFSTDKEEAKKEELKFDKKRD